MQLPAQLKQKLVEDWQRVDRGEQQALPRRPSITDILQQYVDSTKSSRDTVEPEEEASIVLLSVVCLMLASRARPEWRQRDKAGGI